MPVPREELFFRNNGTISSSGQFRLEKAKIAIIGLGGTGGFALETLARSGAGNFVLFDQDRFELSNMNRQLLATVDRIDDKKAEAAAERARSINPGVSVRAYHKKFKAGDGKKLDGCDIILDCSDSLETRFAIADACAPLRIPFVFSSASFSRGMVSVVTPGFRFKRLFRKGDTCASVICAAPALAGILAASQAINFLLGKKFVEAPEFLFFDLFSDGILWTKRL